MQLFYIQSINTEHLTKITESVFAMRERQLGQKKTHPSSFFYCVLFFWLVHISKVHWKNALQFYEIKDGVL